jgi:hypothetical protein
MAPIPPADLRITPPEPATVNAIVHAELAARYTRDKLRGPALDGRIMYVVCRFTELRELRVITVFAEDDES